MIAIESFNRKQRQCAIRFLDNMLFVGFGLRRYLPSTAANTRSHSMGYVFLGVIPNIPGHCVVTDHRTGRVYSGYHTENFVEIPEDDA